MRASMMSFWMFAVVVGSFASAQVNLPPGFEIVEFAVDERGTGRSDINDCGQIVFDKNPGPNSSYSEIYLYDNGKIVQITNNRDGDVFPLINNRGQMVWGRGIGADSMTQIIFYDHGVETIVDSFPQGTTVDQTLNNLGHVGWVRVERDVCPIRCNMFIWDGTTITQQTFDRDMANMGINLNDNGDFAWLYANYCDDPWHSEILTRSANGDKLLPSPTTQNHTPHINQFKQVVWDSDIQIVYWTGDQLLILSTSGSVPNLNNSGRVYSAVWDFGGRNKWQPWVFDVHENGIDAYRLTDDPFSYSRGSVNDWGEVCCTWYTYREDNYWGGGVRFLRRIRTGDSEFDGDIDHEDYRRFATSMTGPVPTDGLCEVRFLDIDYDGDLDLADYARFQNVFTGASP